MEDSKSPVGRGISVSNGKLCSSPVAPAAVSDRTKVHTVTYNYITNEDYTRHYKQKQTAQHL